MYTCRGQSRALDRSVSGRSTGSQAAGQHLKPAVQGSRPRQQSSTRSHTCGVRGRRSQRCGARGRGTHVDPRRLAVVFGQRGEEAPEARLQAAKGRTPTGRSSACEQRASGGGRRAKLEASRGEQWRSGRAVEIREISEDQWSSVEIKRSMRMCRRRRAREMPEGAGLGRHTNASSDVRVWPAVDHR